MKNKAIFVLVCVFMLLSDCQTKAAVNRDMHKPPYDDWAARFDFDGNGMNDIVHSAYSGGAHCCYTIAIELSGSGRTYAFPFEMDGGYEFGLDLSRPSHFNIKDYDGDGLPEIFMEINTYNGEKYPLPVMWAQEYGIKTNHILIEYKNEEMTARDFPGYISVE
jgi:hypothetical protein